MLKKTINFDKMMLGSCYYPEHWDKSLWVDDLNRMQECGIEIIRISEFAWNIFEPSEGRYCFDLFDEFLLLVKQYNIKVILCTPTATPPAWLTEKYPEVLNSTYDGKMFKHGMRRQYNYNSVKYHELTEKIVTRLAQHYAEHPAVIGWQIDNELNCEIDVFYSESDHVAFREFLKEKYKTLENLNKAWGTAFWSQDYSDWSQVYLRRVNACNDSSNPHLALDEKRFISNSCIKYCKLQHDILRANISSNQFITTNGMFSHLDNHKMTETALDFFTYDSYPNFGYSLDNTDTLLRDRKWSYNLSKVRSVCPTFGIMEQQSGANGWVDRMLSVSPKPGQMRLWTFQSVAHGADFISYFRWRTCNFGTEIYWHGLNDYSNIPNRRIDELKQINSDFKRLSGLPKAEYKADFALVRDYDNEWDGELDRWHGPLASHSERSWFTASTFTHTPMDVLQISATTKPAELKRYKMLVYPHAAILPKHIAALLEEYVSGGGILVMGARTGYKDENGHCPMHPMPGLAESFCKTMVKEFTMLPAGDKNPKVNMFNESFNSIMFHDIVVPTDKTATIVGRYSGGYYNGEAAAVENGYGKGKTLYFGGVFTEEICTAVLKHYGMLTPYSNTIALSKDCEIAVRENKEGAFLFVLNYSDTEQPIEVKQKMFCITDEKEIGGNVVIKPYDVMIFNI